jgi:cation diffusion facilitator family transporter
VVKPCRYPSGQDFLRRPATHHAVTGPRPGRYRLRGPLADTIHNFADALTAVPLFIAFRPSQRPATRRYTYGFRRAEDLAGLFVIAMIAVSALVAGFEAIDRLIHPRPLSNLGWLFAAGLIGYVGNELVALYRIRIGGRIGSAALEADGYHARTDGFTSLAVALGAGGAWLGFERADPIVGLLISIAIFSVLRGGGPPDLLPPDGRRRPGHRR